MLEMKVETIDGKIHTRTKCNTKNNLQILEELMSAVTNTLDTLSEKSVQAGADPRITQEYYNAFIKQLHMEAEKRTGNVILFQPK